MPSLYGGVTQLARVVGSYPACHPFESDRRYHEKVPKLGTFSYIRQRGENSEKPKRAQRGTSHKEVSLRRL